MFVARVLRQDVKSCTLDVNSLTPTPLWTLPAAAVFTAWIRPALCSPYQAVGMPEKAVDPVELSVL
jgi:hypothetical protein